MKLRDPFGGFKVAKGHWVFHLALWIATFTVERQVKNTPRLTENSDDELAGRIIEAFHLMRNVHLFVLILSIPQELARRQGLRDKKDKTLVKVSSYMPEKVDTPWKLVR